MPKINPPHGAHLVGAEVTELIQGFVVAMNLETTEEERKRQAEAVQAT